MDQFPPPPPVPPLPEPLLAPERPEVPWRAREALLILTLGAATALFVTALAAGSLHGSTLVLFSTLVIEASLGLWVVLWVRLRHGRGLAALGLRFRPSDIGVGVLAALAGLTVGGVINAIVISIANGLNNQPVKLPQQLPDINRGRQWLLAAIAVVVVAPIAEELFFRGFLYQALRRWRGVPQGILLSAAIFGLAHISPLIIPAIFALGVILAFVFERRGSLAATISAHMTYNLLGFLLLYSRSVR